MKKLYEARDECEMNWRLLLTWHLEEPYHCTNYFMKSSAAIQLVRFKMLFNSSLMSTDQRRSRVNATKIQNLNWTNSRCNTHDKKLQHLLPLQFIISETWTINTCCIGLSDKKWSWHLSTFIYPFFKESLLSPQTAFLAVFSIWTSCNFTLSPFAHSCT